MTRDTDFSIHWANPEDAQRFWLRDRIHWPDQISPMEFDWWQGTQEGMNAANRAYGLPDNTHCGRFNTYLYTLADLAVETAHTTSDAVECRISQIEAKLSAVADHLPAHWSQKWLPEIKEHLAFWEEHDLTQTSLPDLLEYLDESYARHVRLWEIHFLLAWPLAVALDQFVELYTDLFPEDPEMAAYELLTGLENKTVTSARVLWELSRRVLQSPSLSATLLPPQAALATPAETWRRLDQSAEGRKFRADLEAYLSEYGQRGGKWGWRYPAWIEDPAPVFHTLRDYCNQSDRDLVQEMVLLATKRRQRVAEARHRLSNYPAPIVHEFDRLLQIAEVASVLREDHAYWIDFRASYQIRRVLLACGRPLVETNRLGDINQLFYLSLTELRAALSECAKTDMKRGPRSTTDTVADSTIDAATIARRQAEMTRFANCQPPPTLGVPPGPDPFHAQWSESTFWRANGKVNGALVRAKQAGVVQGQAGSPGLHRGVARLAETLEEARLLRPGEVLITESTAPPWTPLFAIAGAVVTEVGGILSHCAIVAREYGIPAVVGAQGATSVIHDGQLVEVDGRVGVVRVVEPPTETSMAAEETESILL